MTRTKLFLDDLRDPPDATWVIVRSEQEFKAYITVNGVPDLISFDHDLGGDESGYNLAKWLVSEGYRIRDFTVHSANPVGAENIRGLLNNWKKYCDT